MIAARLYNLRAYKKALEYAKKQHTTVCLLYKLNGQMYCVDGLNANELELLPQYFTEYLYFWRRTKQSLERLYGDKIKYVSLPDFIDLVNNIQRTLFNEV